MTRRPAVEEGRSRAVASRDGEPRGVELPPPPGLRGSRIGLPGDDFLLLEWTAPRADLPPQLTRAEVEVARLALAGLSNRQIASRRRRSPRTVANQLAAMFRKLGVCSRLELFALFARGEPATEEVYPGTTKLAGPG